MAVTRADHGMNVLSLRRATVRVEGVTDGPGEANLEDPAPVLVGTSAECSLRLVDETASRRHCRLALTEKGVELTDEGSRNGTWIGGTRLRSALLTTDTRIRVGGSTLVVTLGPERADLPLSEATAFGGARGVSRLLRHVFALLERASETDVTVLLEGESGVGKELLARGVHDHSRRSSGPFVTVDCGAIAPTLFESELFGHERGAFTGADSARQGLFREAHGGTLFFDEIGELPRDLQPKLLRLLELREARAVGSDRVITSDVRVIAATNRALLAEVERGAFRRDLYYRLAVARVHVPALRDRSDDIELLATHFFRRATGDDAAELPPDMKALFLTYVWPGNIRELKNVVERYAYLGFSESELFDRAPGTKAVPSVASAVASTASPAGDALLDMPYHLARQKLLERFEAEYVPHVMARAGGVITKASELARIARPTFYRLVERYEARKK
jgi:DNA-binding NtrC family response regulator